MRSPYDFSGARRENALDRLEERLETLASVEENYTEFNAAQRARAGRNIRRELAALRALRRAKRPRRTR